MNERKAVKVIAETGLPRTSGGLPLPVTDTQGRHRIVHSKRGLTKIARNGLHCKILRNSSYIRQSATKQCRLGGRDDTK
jgi:hypothetical protein